MVCACRSLRSAEVGNTVEGSTPPKPHAPRKTPAQPPRQPDKLTTGSKWLFRAAPGTDTGAAAADLRSLLAEPEVAALLTAAAVPAFWVMVSLTTALGGTLRAQ